MGGGVPSLKRSSENDVRICSLILSNEAVVGGEGGGVSTSLCLCRT